MGDVQPVTEHLRGQLQGFRRGVTVGEESGVRGHGQVDILCQRADHWGVQLLGQGRNHGADSRLGWINPVLDAEFVVAEVVIDIDEIRFGCAGLEWVAHAVTCAAVNDYGPGGQGVGQGVQDGAGL